MDACCTTMNMQTHTTCDTPWLSFSTAERKGKKRNSSSPATLSKAFCRPCLVYPLASLDVSGQWPVSRAAASPNEVFAVRFANDDYNPVLRWTSRVG